MESSPVEPEPVDLKTEPAGSHKEPNSAPTVSQQDPVSRRSAATDVPFATTSE